ncbi:MAG: hypothetical protein CL845_06940 [Crocinitomicaceae bacterium]|nr:hypothetical protein [Crocinitomicaceae bacterium]HBP45239.1 hypothetical protein [Flavobacteriales bacterium]|tara:strand:- start:1863 stop:2474 length:612 start_codon:yes stop_codon:yes gene_type:complete
MWATWISRVFHPLLMPLVTLIMVFALDPYLQALPEVFMYMAVVVLVNTLAPAVSIFVLHKRGYLSDLDIRIRKERTLPFIIVLAYFIMTYALLVLRPALYIPLVYLDMWMGLMASIGLALIITRWFKISMHMLAQGGVLGIAMAVQAMQTVPTWTLNGILVFIAGWVGFARIHLNVHRHIEVYIGYLLGFVVCFCAMVFGLGA